MAFSSGQDTKTLQIEGNDTNCFVSLIVDTKGTYQAAITRKVQKKVEITRRDLGSSYEFFGQGPVSSGASAATTREIVDEEIQYFMLDVEREVVDNPYDYLDARFEEIERNKTSKYKYPVTECKIPATDNKPVMNDWFNKPTNFKEPFLFDNDTMEELKVEDGKPDPDLIKQTVAKLLLCSLAFKNEGFDMKQWIIKHMDNVYKKTFASPAQFNEWCDFAVEYFVTNFDDEKLAQDNWDNYYALVAEAMLEELEPYRSNNTYIDNYCNSLTAYTEIYE